MKRYQLIGILLISILTLSFYTLKNQSIDNSKDIFESWIKLHRKVYSEQQFTYRFDVWNKNLKYVLDHNSRYAKGEQTYDLEMNMFADLTSEEFGQKYLMKNFENTNKCTGKQPTITSLPDEVDWSKKGAVTGIKNQGQCGSCWAFSATGSLQGAHFLSKGSLKSFSEQQLVDCSYSYKNMGCAGGLMDNAFFYVIDHGITLQSNYPYKGIRISCKYKPQDQQFRISNCVDVTLQKQANLMAGIAQQPVSVAIQANHMSFQLYKSGVYNGNCGTKLDHGVLAVGYGQLNQKKYYKVKNSWGESWGQQGYVLIARTGDGQGKCGIQLSPSFPLV